MSSVPAVFLSVDSAIPVSTSTSAAISIATSIAGSSGSSDNSSPGGTTPANPVVDVDNLIFHVDLVFFALFAAFCLFTLPRAFAVLCRPSVFFGSLFLRRRPSSQPLEPLQREFSTARRVPQRNVSTKTTRSMGKTEESYTVDSHAHLLSMPRQGTQKSASYSVPTRVPSWITLTHPTIVSIVNYPLAPGLTFIKAFALVLVFGVLCYAAFYQSDPFTDPKRAGFIAMGIFPIVAALACKNNVFTWFSGVGYEKLNYLHRFAGHLVVLAANIHGIGFIYQWALDGSFYTHMQSPQIQWAFVTLGSLDLVYLGSREFVRKKSHTFFLITHLLGFGLAALGAVNHKNVTLPYIASGVLVYTLDRVLRVARMRVATGYVTPVPSLNGGTTHVHIPGLNRGFRAGQHVRVRIIDGQGFFPWINTILFSRARPFSVASRPNGAGLELLIKKESGCFTTRLYDIAKADSKYSEKTKDVAQAEMGLPTHKVQFVVEGPYGGPSYTMFESYSGVLLVAGGSGISYTLSILDDLLAKHAAGQSRVRAIEVVWSVGDPSCVAALLPTLRPFLRPRPSPHSALAIRITVNYTRAPRGPLPDPERLPNGLNIQSGRLDALRSLETTADRVLSVGPRFPGVAPTSGVVAACCGPPDLVEQVRTAVGQVSWERWRDVGGVENVSETFEF